MGARRALLGLSFLCIAAALRVWRDGPADEADEEPPHEGPADYESWRLWEPGQMSGQRLVKSNGAEYFLPMDSVAELQAAFVDKIGVRQEMAQVCIAKGRCCMMFNRSQTAKEAAKEPSKRRRLGYKGFQVVNVEDPALTPFIVPEDQPNRTDVAVVVVPGGGPHHLAWESEGTDAARWLNSLGISAFVLRYRTSLELWPKGSQIMDVQRAVSIVRSRAADFHLNVSRIGLFGAGYGGELATDVSAATARLYQADDRDHELLRPNFQILLYPTFPVAVIEKDKEGNGNTSLWNATLVPPTFMVATADDGCVRPQEVISHHAILHPGRNLTELHIYPDGGHAFGFCYRQGKQFMLAHEVCMWPKRAELFLRYFALNERDAAMEESYWRMRDLIGFSGETWSIPRSYADP